MRYSIAIVVLLLSHFLNGRLPAQTDQEIEVALSRNLPKPALHYVSSMLVSSVYMPLSEVESKLGIDRTTVQKIRELDREIDQEAQLAENYLKKFVKGEHQLLKEVRIQEDKIFGERIKEFLTEKQIGALFRVAFQVGFSGSMRAGEFDDFLGITSKQHAKFSRMQIEYVSGKLRKNRKGYLHIEQFMMAELTEKQQDLVLRMVGPPFKDGWVEAFLKEREEKKKEEERQRELNSKQNDKE